MSAKVYLVTAGEYSDYRVEAVFTNRELAEKFCRIRTDCEIDERELDVPSENWPRWVVRLEGRRIEGRWLAKLVYSGKTESAIGTSVTVSEDENSVGIRAFGSDKEHAEKAAFDAYAKAIAAKEGL